MKSLHITNNEEETEKLGEEFAKELKTRDVVFLIGELGAGKTTFVKGVAKGLGIESRIISPTFVVLRTHTVKNEELRIKTQGIKTLYHLDLYRLESVNDIKNIDIDNYANDKTGVVFVEWPEKAEGFIKPAWEVKFESLKNDKHKITTVSSQQLAVSSFVDGGIVIFPTDTAFGMGCRIDKEESIKRLFEIRKRPLSKPLIALVSSIEMAEEYVEIPENVREKLINKYWPGGLTIILRTKPGKVLSPVTAGEDTLGIRLPDNEQIRSIIQGVGVPIVAPSANYSGEKTPFLLDRVDSTLKQQVDFVLSGVCTMEGVSTIIDCTVSPWKILREGVAQI